MEPIDISTPIRDGMPGFPGDPRVRIRRTRSLDRGDSYNLSELTLGSHTGTHVDPPLHFLSGGPGVDRIDLSTLNGPCYLIRLPESKTEVGPEDVARVPPDHPRVLFRTRNSDRWSRDESFFPDYVALTPSGADALLTKRVRLVGIDSLSIEKDESGRYPVHHTLLEGGMLILEGLRLKDVPEGTYELRCLPLRLLDGDGGPCRALLLPG